jgi:hypothetical protein
MPGLVPGIHVFFFSARKQGVDGRNKSGHDEILHAASVFSTSLTQ